MYRMENKDLNRLKVVLAEKNAPINGLSNNWEKTLPQFPNGALTVLNKRWRI